MFKWFLPKCPVDPSAKKWLEERLAWLGTEFPSNILTDRPMVLPTAEFFPDSYDGTEDAARRLFRRICLLMYVHASDANLKFYTAKTGISLVNGNGEMVPHTPAGTYRRSFRHNVEIERSQLDDPICLVGTMAHELSHALLMGSGRVPPYIFDNELLTDLTAVFLGFGIFMANRHRHWNSHMTYWPGTKLRKPEYMSPPMYGYALAHAAWFKNEARPQWTKFLHWTARTEFKHALKYLTKIGDSSLVPPWKNPASNPPESDEPT